MRSLARPVSLLCLAALAPWALDGCVSLRVTQVPGAAGRGGVEVVVYEDAGARDAGRPLGHPVFTHLYRLEEGGRVSVARSLAPAWRLGDLPAGRYRLEATKEIDERGDIRDLPRPGAKSFAVADGAVARVEVLRRKVPVALVVLAAVTVVALVVLLLELDRHGDLPKPPKLPPLPLPPVDVAVAIDFAFLARGAGPGRDVGPSVVDVFPARGSVVAARRVAISFLLGAAMVSDPEPGAIQALGSTSGELAGATSYLPAEQLLRFLPERDFAPGETITVTLDLARVPGARGRGTGLVSTSFRVPVR